MARLMSTVMLLVLLGALAPGCGGGDNDVTASPAEGVETQPARGTTRTTVYFLIDNGAAPIGVRRTIQTRSPYAGEALDALLAGPTADEKESGITTEIPPGTSLLAMTYARHGADQTVNLAGLPPDADSIGKHRIIAQIARTLIGVSGIERIWLEADGEPWGLTLIDGTVYSGPFGYEQLVGWDIGVGCPGMETVECDHFDAVP
jgi:spore germination protein GerM